MKLTLKPLQSRILVKLGTAGELSINRLVEASMPRRDLNPDKRSRWDHEIRLQIELLGLYGLIQLVDRLGQRFCIAPAFVVQWTSDQLQKPVLNGMKQKPSIVLPLLVASVLTTATAGCSSFPGMTQETPAPVVTRYNAEKTPPPERMEQFYNPRSGNMVYRFCVGNECPGPTPKKPIQTLPVVTEVNIDGSKALVASEPGLAFGQAKPFAKVVSVSKAKPAEGDPAKAGASRTAANDKASAAIAAQRQEHQNAAGGSITPSGPSPAPKLSVKTMGADPRPAVVPARQAPAATEGGQLFVPANEKGMRVPSAPSAKVAPLEGNKLAMSALPARVEPVGGSTTPIMVTDTVEQSSGATPSNSAEQFVAGWANLWSEKKADSYFKLYANDFWPTYGQNQSASVWETLRRDVMTRPGAIKVGVEMVKVVEKEDKAIVRFWQTYESKSFRSRVLKSLELVKADGDWKIRRERLIPVDSAPTVA
ncbi:MAG: hypothetical protein FD131_3354 [Rhodocyclaceae bacterium]|nr:MAG: hypothetical protein FD131_3354 [Rhodocyclaceae bacterium]